MKNKILKFLSLILTCAIACSCALSISANGNISDEMLPDYGDLVQPCYSNCDSCATSFAVADGMAYMFVTYYAYTDSFTYAKLTAKIQKQVLGIFWTTVDIGTTNNEWVSYNYSIDGIFDKSYPVDGYGTYRVLYTLEVYGNDGTVDVIEDTIKCVYDGK